MKKLLEGIRFTKEKKGDRIRIPVCYGGEYGPDLEEVAEYHHMTPEEVVKIHTGGDYLVYMIGFAPGFPYVGGLPCHTAHGGDYISCEIRNGLTGLERRW